MKINKKAMYGLGILTSVTMPVVGVLSCGVSESNQDQDKLNKITSKQVRDVLKLPGDTSKLPSEVKPPTNLSKVEINDIKDVDLKITNWKIDEAKGEITFIATISKTGLTSKDIDVKVMGYHTTNIIQDRLNAITLKQVRDAFGGLPVDDTKDATKVAKPSDLLGITINDVDGIDLKITASNWILDDVKGAIFFTATASKTGYTSKDIDVVITGYKHTIITLTQGNKTTNSSFDAPTGALTINGNVDIIGDHAFEDGNYITGDASTAIKNLIFASNNIVTKIGSSAFNNAKITTLTLPDSVTTIADNGFNLNTDLTTLVLSNSLTTINDFSFWKSPITSLIIPDSVTQIAGGSFNSASLTSLIFKGDIPSQNRILTLGPESFNGTPIINIKDSHTQSAADWQAWAIVNAADAFKP